MENNKLNVGDRLYKTSHYKTIEQVVTIERVTNTQAFSSSMKFKRELSENGIARLIGGSSWTLHYWKKENEELQERLFRQNSIKYIKEVDYKLISTDKLKQILDILITK